MVSRKKKAKSVSRRLVLTEGSYTQVQNWIAQPPTSLEIQTATPLLPNLSNKLGLGEQEAISLAVQLNAALIILDDMDARQAAIAQGLNVTGLLRLFFVVMKPNS